MIEVSQVSKSYGDKCALDAVSMTAPDGAVTGFVGPNGAGKSTLLRIIARLTVPDAGRVSVDGADFAHKDHPGNALGVFLTAEHIPGHMTASSFLAYASDVQGLPRHRVEEVLDTVGLAEARHKRVRSYSLGMRQRLGIGAAILGRPRNLVLDEPVNGLDPEGIYWLRRCVRAVARDGGAVLLSSHHMSELSQVADEVVLLDHGRVVKSGPTASFVAEDVRRTYIETTDLEAASRLLSAHGYAFEHCSTSGAVVHGAAPEEIGRLLFREGPGVSHLRQLTRSLEETYFAEISSGPASREA